MKLCVQIFGQISQVLSYGLSVMVLKETKTQEFFWYPLKFFGLFKMTNKWSCSALLVGKIIVLPAPQTQGTDCYPAANTSKALSMLLWSIIR